MDNDVQVFYNKIVTIRNALRANPEILTLVNDLEVIFKAFIKRLNDIEMQKTGIENEEKISDEELPPIVYRNIRYNNIN
jgi:hypothetical protein